MWVSSLRTNAAVAAVFTVLLITFTLLTFGAFNPDTTLTEIGGWFGIATAVLAWYASFAGVMNATWGKTLLPTYPLRSSQRPGEPAWNVGHAYRPTVAGCRVSPQRQARLPTCPTGRRRQSRGQASSSGWKACSVSAWPRSPPGARYAGCRRPSKVRVVVATIPPSQRAATKLPAPRPPEANCYCSQNLPSRSMSSSASRGPQDAAG